jgi:hypothetical protein
MSVGPAGPSMRKRSRYGDEKKGSDRTERGIFAFQIDVLSKKEVAKGGQFDASPCFSLFSCGSHNRDTSQNFVCSLVLRSNKKLQYSLPDLV